MLQPSQKVSRIPRPAFLTTCRAASVAELGVQIQIKRQVWRSGNSHVDGVSHPNVREQSRDKCGSSHHCARRAWLPNSSGKYWAILNLWYILFDNKDRINRWLHENRAGLEAHSLNSWCHRGKLRNHSIILCREKEQILAVLTSVSQAVSLYSGECQMIWIQRIESLMGY